MSSFTPINPAALFSVSGLVAVVTGGGTGLGLVMTRALVAGGASKVFILGRRLSALESAAASVNADAPASASGPVVVPVQCDATSTDSLAAAARTVESQDGFVNLLICNAGTPGPAAAAATPETTAEEFAAGNLAVPFEDFVGTFAVNAAGVWYTAMSFLGLLDRGNKKGNVTYSSQIIVTGSIGAFNKKPPMGFVYGQSKAAVTLATKQLSVVLPQWNIRTNAIAPGLFPSELAGPVIAQLGGDEHGNIPKDIIPMGRMGKDEDMAGLILYMASRAGAYCNGSVMFVDGGRLNALPSTF